MKKLIIPMLIFLAWATSLSAQITREQADKIVLEHLQNEVTLPYFLYVNVNAPSEAGIAVTTFQEETFTAKYACWAYYLNEYPEVTEPTQHRYLFVKANDGNLLEVITSNDMIPDLTQWIEVTTAINELEKHVKIYPNPTNGELIVENGELTIENMEIFDLMGRLQKNCTSSLRGTECRSNLENEHTGLLHYVRNDVSEVSIDISHLPVGIYFMQITTEAGVITRKIVKN
jgi:hypothetical protein